MLRVRVYIRILYDVYIYGREMKNVYNYTHVDMCIYNVLKRCMYLLFRGSDSINRTFVDLKIFPSS